MKKLVILLLATILAACSSAPTAAPTEPPAPTATVVEPTQTPVVVVQTVVVESTLPPTDVPTATLPPPTNTTVPPTAEIQVVTVVVEPTQGVQVVAPTATSGDTSGGLITIDQNLGAGWFSNITLTKNILALRCQLYKEITFSVKPLDPNIKRVDFYYRIVDRSTGTAFDWQNAGLMPPSTDGSFVLAFSGDKVNANFRKPNAWLDFQFIGLSQSGGVVGRSEKIEQQVTYSLDCP